MIIILAGGGGGTMADTDIAMLAYNEIYERNPDELGRFSQELQGMLTAKIQGLTADEILDRIKKAYDRTGLDTDNDDRVPASRERVEQLTTYIRDNLKKSLKNIRIMDFMDLSGEGVDEKPFYNIILKMFPKEN